MREILFRGQRITDKKWVEGFLLQGINKGVMLIQFWDDERGYCMEDIIPETVGQFTGLTDKNGVKIFEGDLLEDEKGSILVLKFGQFEAGKDDFDIAYIPTGFYASFSDGGTYCINSGGGGYAIESKRCSIIGNIHENTDLLI